MNEKGYFFLELILLCMTLGIIMFFLYPMLITMQQKANEIRENNEEFSFYEGAKILFLLDKEEDTIHYDNYRVTKERASICLMKVDEVVFCQSFHIYYE